MNRHCAAWCVGCLKTYARGNNIITDMNSEAYKNMMGDIIENVWLNVGTRADGDFDIKEDGDILRICNEVEHAAGLVLMGAGDGKYNKFLGTTVSRSESISLNPNVQRQDDNTKFVRGGSIFNRIADKMRRV